MTTAPVTVEFVNPPKEGKKMGSIKTQELGTIFVWPNQLSIFKQGHHYTIEYSEANGFKKFEKMAPPPPSPEDNIGDTAGFPEHELLPARTVKAHVDATLQEHIFVCGIVNNWVSRTDSEVTQSKLIALVNASRVVWAQTFGM